MKKRNQEKRGAGVRVALSFPMGMMLSDGGYTNGGYTKRKEIYYNKL
jgi:hypothetical protein